MTDDGLPPTATIAYEEEPDTLAWKAQVVAGPDVGLTAVVASTRIVIGTGPSAALRLGDPTVSRLHCELASEEGGVRLRDLGSKNGCWYAGSRVIEVVLSHGSRVHVGATVLEIVAEHGRVRRPIWGGGDRWGSLLGSSPPMQRLFVLAFKVASTEARVLLRGESGTGKELLARAIHDSSRRRNGPFVVLDCAALSRHLADVDLFGHARGAFTGADMERASVFERASGGTLFIDEVGELPFELQPKLLRALDQGDIQRIGEGFRRPVDVRFIAATNAPVERMINAGSFREDLYYRLSSVELHVPPLRDRGRDIVALARHIAEQVWPGDPAALDLVEREIAGRAGHSWPGNVRELRNFVLRVVALGGDVHSAGDFSREVAPPVRIDLPYRDAKHQWTTAFERQYLLQLLDDTGGNVAEASRMAGLHRSSFYELLTKHGLSRRADR